MKRRDFLKLSVAAGTATLGMGGIKGMSELAAAEVETGPVPVFRTLGRTGLKVSVVSFGAMLTPEYEVIQAGLDQGINYIDTARRYMGGRNEEIVGKAIRGRRDKLFIATKTPSSARKKSEIVENVEASLAALGTDHIDVIQLHNVDNRNKDRIFDPETREALRELRKQGKVRFFGVTSHTDQAEILEALVSDAEKFFDTALVGYNFKSGPELKTAIARAAQAGIGIIAMKTQAGGYQTEELGKISPHQAALKWVLQDANVATAIPGMKDMGMLKEDIAVMSMKLTAADLKLLDRYGKAVEGRLCRLCARCEPGCPRGVAISTVNRSLMYAEGYREMDLARSTYGELAPEASAAACTTCPGCTANCANGLDIARRMATARALLG